MSDTGTYFPLFIDLNKKSILVYGAGRIALRRISSLLDFGANIKVVSPECTDEITAFAAQKLLVYEKKTV